MQERQIERPLPKLDEQALKERVQEAGRVTGRCFEEVARRIVGQRPMLEGMMMGLLARGHVLLEGVPGLAKTLAVRTLADVLDIGFRRLQFTPDLLPADLVGTMVYHQQTGEFLPRKGPIFSNVVLADEINRSPAKVQSALLEAMEERQVTLGGETWRLEEPFLVLATQNPIEHEGTYALPEAQLDRFLLKLRVSYPAFPEEVEILRRVGTDRPIPVSKVIGPADLARLQETAQAVQVDGRIEEYIVSVVAATRGKEADGQSLGRYIEYGASPRASICLYRCAKVKALLAGRSFVIPEDVKAAAPAVMRHRIILTYEAESETLSTDQVIAEILRTVPVP